jgi:membrane peptidoglycan carboxypeptidase
VCSLAAAAASSLDTTFFDLTGHLGAASVLATARDAGIDWMWDGSFQRMDLRTVDPASLTGPSSAAHLTDDLGLGRYAITVLDNANGMATLAANGHRSQVHFVREVLQAGTPVYTESLVTTKLGLTDGQFADLDAALGANAAGHFSDQWQTAAKAGEWADTGVPGQNSDVWTVGYTKVLATAVWVGSATGKPLVGARSGAGVDGAEVASPIFQQYLRTVTPSLFPNPTPAMQQFDLEAFTGTLTPPGSVGSASVMGRTIQTGQELTTPAIIGHAIHAGLHFVLP